MPVGRGGGGLPKGILFSPQFRSHQEISNQGDGPLELNDRHLRSPINRGL